MEERPEPQPLKAALRERGVTYRELAGAVGLSAAWISHHVNGRREPSVSLRRAIAAHLDVSEDELFHDASTQTNDADDDDPLNGHRPGRRGPGRRSSDATGGASHERPVA